MKKVLMIGALLAMCAGCATRTEPMMRVRDFKYGIVTRQNALEYMDEAFRRVREREPSTRWKVVDATESSIRVNCAWRKNAFDVDVVLGDRTYTITYVSSKNLNVSDDGSRIYPAYNKLVRYFAEELNDINHGRYTDPLYKTTRSTAMGGDYFAERNPNNVGGFAMRIDRRNARAVTAGAMSERAMDADIKCPYCGSLIDQGARFCSECGKSLVDECPKCHTPAQGRFCAQCGEKLTNDE